MSDPLTSPPVAILGASGQIGGFLMRRLAGEAAVALARRPRSVAQVSGIPVVPLGADGGLPALDPAPWASISTLPIWALEDFVAPLAGQGVRRLVCFSTSSIEGKAGTRSAGERATVDRVRRGEMAVARACADHGVGLTVLRPTLIYGAGRDRTISAAARFIQRHGFYPVAGAARGLRQPVHADDLAAAALGALDSPATVGLTYFLGGGETLPYRDMIARIFTMLDRPVRIVRVPFLAPVLSVAGAILPGSELTGDVARRMNRDLAFDDGVAGRDFGYAPRAFLAGGRADLGLQP